MTYGEEKTGENKEKPALSSALGAAAPSQGVPLGQAGLVPLGFKAQKADFLKNQKTKKPAPFASTSAQILGQSFLFFFPFNFLFFL